MDELKFLLGEAWVDLSKPMDISIPLHFSGPQPNAFGVETATSEACVYGDLVGDTRRGGSCNFERITLIPHCNGTHTECVGHLTNERISVRECLKDVFVTAKLISIEPQIPNGSRESYAIPFVPDDRVITHDQIEQAIGLGESQALLIRTLPNNDNKLTERYDVENIPPYFTTQAIEYISGRGFRHLLVDLPSVDRLYDEGKLSNHRMFWNLEPGSFETNGKTRRESTITELIYVPNEIEDGEYVLNLQIAPFESDASPSRPIIFKLKNS
jgi:arylformamidase